MANPTRVPGHAAVREIKIGEKWQRDYWAFKFGCSAQQLEAAVRSVGPDLTRVTKFLSGNVRLVG